MILKITQNSVGRYNLCSEEETRNFYMGIYDDEGKIIKDPENDKIIAQIHWNGDKDEDEWIFDSLTEVPALVQKCWNYYQRIISTINYKANFKFFVKTYQENFEILSANYKKEKIEKIKSEIERLKSELEQTEKYGGLEDASYEINKSFDSRISLVTKWKEGYDKELEDLKEGTETYNTKKEKADNYQKEIDDLESCKVKYYEDYETK